LLTVLNGVQQAVISSFSNNAKVAERAARTFGDYRQGAARMPEYAARFADMLAQSRESGSPFTREDATALARAAASAALVIGGHPSGFMGLSPEQLASATQAGGHLSAATTRAITGKKPGQVSSEDYALVTDSARELIRRAATGVRELSAHGPMIILLDTGEVIGDRAWGWLRRTMTQTGPRVAWVIGARFETEAEAGADSPIVQFVRDIGDEHLMLMSPTRFDDIMIRNYLERRHAQRTYTQEQVKLIAGFTRGLPLAVSFTATLLDQGQTVEEACQQLDDGQPNSVVSRLARRYLVHSEKQNYPAEDPRRDDVTKILALAVAFGDLRKDPELLAALWDIKPDQAQASFDDLALRHDFVLQGSYRLHDDVRETLRTDLLAPFRRIRAKEINKRARALLEARLAQMRQRWPTLEEQLAHAAFTTTVLAALWHTLWEGNDLGLAQFTQLLPVLAVGDPPAAEAAADMINYFAETFDEDQRRHLDLLTQSPSAATPIGLLLGRGTVATDKRRVRITLPGLALNEQGANECSIGEPGDRLVANMILQAGLYVEDHNDQAAVMVLHAAANRTTSSRLREVIGARAQVIATGLLRGPEPGKLETLAVGFAAIKLAAETLPDSASAWEAYAAILDGLGQADRAQAAHERARELDFEVTEARSIVGLHEKSRELDLVTHLIDMGRAAAASGYNEEALARYDLALVVDPKKSVIHSGRGNSLHNIGRYDEALEAYAEALVLNPRNSQAIAGRGISLVAVGRYEEALGACDEALAANGSSLWAYTSKGAILMALGRYREALVAYDEVLALSHDAPEACGNRGTVLAALGRYEEALDAYDKALVLDQGNLEFSKDRDGVVAIMGREVAASYYNNKGAKFCRAADHRSALEAFDKALAADPDNVEAYVNQGVVFVALGRYEQALVVYGNALRMQPYNAVAHERNGIVMAVLGRFELALAEFDDAEAIRPEGGGEGPVWAGAVLWHLGDIAGARRRFASVKDWVTDCAPFHATEIEAIALCGIGRPDDAEKHLLDAMLLRAPSDAYEPRAIYRLLADPPLPGIDRVHAIVSRALDSLHH
jgi:tetratricopeptide (TPR) repeat protein